MFVAGCLQSCGARKSNVGILKESEKQSAKGTEKSTAEGEVKKQTESGSTEKTKDQNDITKENTTVTEKYGDDGKIKEKTTDYTKTIDKSLKEQEKTYYIRTVIDSNFRSTNYRTYTITNTVTKYVKQKNTETNNYALYACFLVIGGFVVYNVYRYFRPKIANTL